MQLSIDNLGLTPVSPVAPLTEAVRTVLSKYGSNAHLYTFGPGVPILGPELVVNGDGASAAGWVANASTVSSVGGMLQCVTTGTGDNGAYQDIPVVSGKTYSISAFITNNSASASAGVRAVTESWASLAVSSGIPAGQSGTVSFKATATSAVIRCGLDRRATGVVGDIVRFDDITVREILGYSNTYSGFVAGNYFDSAGTTHASVDGSVGLVLDAAGSVGPNKDAGQLTIDPGTEEVGITGTVVGATFRIYCPDVNVKWNFGPGWITLVQGWNHIKADGSGGRYRNFGASPVTFYPDVREVTGIHATQGTPGYKPTLRKGIVNLLTYSQDFSNAAWLKDAGVTVTSNYAVAPDGTTTASLITTNADNKAIYRSASLTTGQTQAVWLKADAGQVGSTVKVGLALAVTLTDQWQLAVLSGVNDPHQVKRMGTTATSWLQWDAGKFDGTLTAAQILANGGIPLTTTAPASSVAGVNYLEFDGVDDRLALGGPLFQMADDHCVIAGFRAGSTTGTRTVVELSGGGAGDLQRVAQIGVDASNKPVVQWVSNGAAEVVSFAAPFALAQNEPVVVTALARSATCALRTNSVQRSSGVRPSGAATMAISSIACRGSGFECFKGNIHCVLAIKGTVSDADLAVLEKFVAQLSGVTL